MTNITTAKTIEFSDINHLAKLVTENDWSHAIFKNGYRKSDNFEETFLFTLDVDENCSLERAKNIFCIYKHIIATTRNHQKPKDTKPPCDRFRVILFLQEPILDCETYLATWKWFNDKFPFIDQSCKDAGRFWYRSIDIISINDSGELVAPILNIKKNQNSTNDISFENKGILSHATQKLIKDGILEQGSRNISIFRAALDCKQQGYSYDETRQLLSGKSTLPSNEELRAIKSGWDREPKYPPRNKKSENDEIPTELWVNDWLIQNNVSLNYKSNMVQLLEFETPYDLLLSRLSLDSEAEKKHYSDNKIQHALNIWINEQKKNVISHHIKSLEYRSDSNQDLIERFLLAVTGVKRPIDIAVIHHFIWQIKRKLLGLKVGQHLMIILVGKHRGGKTEAIKKLLEPIFQIYMLANDMTVINDERGIKTLNDNYCIFFDEMAKASKVDTDRLKGIISGEHVSYRIMRTNQYVSLKNNCTFIGATNNRVRDLIYDPTSARRFYEIQALDILDHQIINSLSYIDIWKSVDPYSEIPILPYLNELDLIQESEIRNMCLVEEWITNWCVEVSSPDPNQGWWKPDELYANFKKWLEWQNKSSLLPTHNKFLNRISDFKVKSFNSNSEFRVNDINFKKMRTEKGYKYSIRPKELEYL